MRENLDNIAIVPVRETFLRPLRLGIYLVIALTCVIGTALYILNLPPSNFPANETIVIPDGTTVIGTGFLLHENDVIRSPLLFRALVQTVFSDTVVQAGSYQFENKLSTVGVIKALRNGAAQSPAISITFPEGFSVYDMREYTKDAFTSIDVGQVISYEGFLFPETYFISQNETFTDLVSRMKAEHDARMKPYLEEIESSPYSLREIIILASILEREANDRESMETVSGILHNRLNDGLPLQVDATFEYILGKTSEELTIDDLALDSPYNTYTNKGLPPAPISNPGIMAIEAALRPKATDYYYYLTGKDGEFYYAKTFEGHKLNKERYLR
jgi:UPF0755 protein